MKWRVQHRNDWQYSNARGIGPEIIVSTQQSKPAETATGDPSIIHPGEGEQLTALLRGELRIKADEGRYPCEAASSVPVPFVLNSNFRINVTAGV